MLYNEEYRRAVPAGSSVCALKLTPCPNSYDGAVKTLARARRMVTKAPK